MDRVSTGIEGLDAMLHGGLIPARPYVVSGPPGSGKTILAMRFLLDGIRRGESCLMVALDEPPNEVKANMAKFGWSLDRLKLIDATPDIRAHKKTRSVIDVGTTLDVRDMEDVDGIRRSSQMRAMEVSVHSVQKMLKQEFSAKLERTKQRYSRILIDSMTALKLFSMRDRDSRIMIQSFLRFLSELEATSLIVSEPTDRRELQTEFFLARGHVRCHKWLDGNVIRRAVSVEKFRGSAFDDRIRPMTLSSRGMKVNPTGKVQLRGRPEHHIGIEFLERRIVEEVSAAVEAALAAVDEAHKHRIDVKEADSALSRAMFEFHRRQYETALEHARKAKASVDAKIEGRLRRGRGRVHGD